MGITNLPHSESAEAAILAAAMSSDDLQGRVVEIVTEEDFHSRRNKAIYRAIRERYGEGAFADAVSVAEYLKAGDRLRDAGGVDYIASLVNSGYSSSSLEEYGGIVRNRATQRRIIQAADRILNEAQAASHEEVDDLVDSVEAIVLEATREDKKGGPQALRSLLYPAIDRIEERMKSGQAISGIHSGIGPLDHMTSGFQNGDLIIVAARPSMGKSALMNCFALEAAIKHGHPAYKFSLEMSKEQVVERDLSLISGIDAMKIRRGELTQEELQLIAHAANTLHASNIYVDDTPGLTVLDLRSRARRLVRENGPGPIYVDYLQLMEGKGSENRQQEVSKISRGLKGVARELGVPVIALSQLSRGPEHRDDKRPMLSDLRDSGGIEQDADVVMFLYRPEYYYGPHSKDGEDLRGKAEIIVGKQRNGPTGIIRCSFDPETMRFFK